MTIDLYESIPKAFQPLFWNNDRFLILKGSAGSGKSVFAAQKLIFRSLQEEKHKWLIVRKVEKTLKESVYESIIKRIYDMQLPGNVYYRATLSPLKIYLDDAEFLFMGMDDPEKLKSIEGITGAFLEEMTEFTEDDFDQINTRIRDKSDHYRQTIGAFNPISEMHWIKKRFFDQAQTLPTKIHESSYLDNPYLDDEYKALLESYEHTNPIYYQVYCLNQWGVVDTSNKFLHNFNLKKHVGTCRLNDQLPIRLSFDFNIDPMTCSVYQRDGNDILICEFIRLPNSDIENMCDHILSKYGEQHYIVTGDASGGNRTGMVRGKLSYWQVICQRLGIPTYVNSRLKLRRKNLDLTESRILCNLVLSTQSVMIDQGHKELIDDCTYAKVDDRGILIKDRNKQKNDWLDGFRYILDAEFPDIIRKPKKYE